jgi:hypothetical protein
MPYRKLPKTDQSRVRTLQTIINLEKEYNLQSIPLSYNLLVKAKTQLPLFEHHQSLYNQACETWQRNNVRYRESAINIRLYISHFIQVFNLAITRGELRKDGRAFYQLPIDSTTLPDLTSEEAILEWGKNLIEGEMQRTRIGGMPMTNPTIASLKVQYELFKGMRTEQQFRQVSIQRTKENFNIERAKTDVLIKEIWDEIENNFSKMPQEQRIEECTKCGVIYYYRSDKNEISSETEEDNADEEICIMKEKTKLFEIPFDC